MDNDMRGAAKEKLRRKHVRLYNCNAFIHKIGFIMSIFIQSYI